MEIAHFLPKTGQVPYVFRTQFFALNQIVTTNTQCLFSIF